MYLEGLKQEQGFHMKKGPTNVFKGFEARTRVHGLSLYQKEKDLNKPFRSYKLTRRLCLFYLVVKLQQK